MAQIKKRFIAPNAVDGSKIKLLNGESLRATDSSGQEVSLLEFSSGDVLRFLQLPEAPVNPQVDNHLARKGYVDQQVSSEVSARIAADQAESDARQAADSNLQSQIDTEKGRIDAILSASTADKDNFAEIVALINSVDTENDSAFASYVLSNDAALAAETSARQSADQNLQDQIDALDSGSSAGLAQEISDRQAADAALAARLDIVEGDDTTEGSVAKAEQDAKEFAVSYANSKHQDALGLLAAESFARGEAVSAESTARQDADSAEASARQTADDALDARLDVIEGTEEGSIVRAKQDAMQFATMAVAAEQQIRQSGDAALQQSIADEATAREAADSAASARLDVIEGTGEGSVAKAKQDANAYTDGLVNTANTARATADAALQSQIDNILNNTDPAALDSLAEVVAAFQAADSNLNNAISALGTGSSSALTQEIADRQAADSAEASARQAADDAEASARQAADSAEASARQAADTTLQSNIDAEAASREAKVPRHAKHASTLGAGESYKDLSHKAVEESMNVFIDRLALHVGDDYTVSTSPSGHTRVTFTSSLMSSEEGPAAGDLFRCAYAYKNEDQPVVTPPGGGGGGGAPGTYTGDLTAFSVPNGYSGSLGAVDPDWAVILMWNGAETQWTATIDSRNGLWTIEQSALPPVFSMTPEMVTGFRVKSIATGAVLDEVTRQPDGSYA